MWLKSEKKKFNTVSEDHPVSDRERSLGVTGEEEINYPEKQYTGDQLLVFLFTSDSENTTDWIRLANLSNVPTKRIILKRCTQCNLFVVPNKSMIPCCDSCADQYANELRNVGFENFSFYQLMEYIQIKFPKELEKLRVGISKWKDDAIATNDNYHSYNTR